MEVVDRHREKRHPDRFETDGANRNDYTLLPATLESVEQAEGLLDEIVTFHLDLGMTAGRSSPGRNAGIDQPRLCEETADRHGQSFEAAPPLGMRSPVRADEARGSRTSATPTLDRSLRDARVLAVLAIALVITVKAWNVRASATRRPEADARAKPGTTRRISRDKRTIPRKRCLDQGKWESPNTQSLDQKGTFYVPGLRVGHAEDARLGSGATAVIFDEPAVASIDLRGGGPGTRETALLDPAQTVQGIDAIALSGGSAFGLDAASGVQAWLRERGRGFVVRSARVPIVPAAILFDLLSGGDKEWGRFPPYRELGYAAAAGAATDFALGSVGAGTGATTVNCKGGIGSASAQSPDGFIVGALAAVNAAGSVIVGRGPWFWAAPFEQNGEYGGRGLPNQFPAQAFDPLTKGNARESTTLVVVATDAVLTKAQAKRLAVMAQSGLSRAIYPVHSPLDGDVMFAASTGRRALADATLGLAALGTLAANVVARAIARGVFAATALSWPGALASWKDQFGR